MSAKHKFNPREMMEKAVEVMRRSIAEPRPDGNVPPKVGAVLWKPDGTIDTAFRGEFRQGDHAEFTIIERKNGSSRLDDCVLFATLEPCAPDSRKPPKIGCAKRIVNARVKKVYIGCADPHPKVAGNGRKYLKLNDIEVLTFDRDLQEVIEKENIEFFSRAKNEAEAQKIETAIIQSKYDRISTQLRLADLSNDALKQYRSFLIQDSADSSENFHRRLYHQGLLEERNGALLPTGFGVLLFGMHPRDLMEQAGVLGTIRFEDGREELRDFDGPMVFAPEQILKWLKDKLPNPVTRSTARRQELNDTFYELIREGLVNALVHRDYDIKNAKIQLVASLEFVEIRSPGYPVDPITIEQLQTFQAPLLSRNPRLHVVFNVMELAEERGLGLRSMKQSARQAELPLPRFRWEDPYLVLPKLSDSDDII